VRIRERDLPLALRKPPEPPQAKVEPPEWIALAQQIQELQARLATMHTSLEATDSGPKLEQVLELLQAAPSAQPAVPVGAGSEWVFDVKRGPYNEIQNVYAKRVPVGAARPR
jgi:hypothetical protein